MNLKDSYSAKRIKNRRLKEYRIGLNGRKISKAQFNKLSLPNNWNAVIPAVHDLLDQVTRDENMIKMIRKFVVDGIGENNTIVSKEGMLLFDEVVPMLDGLEKHISTVKNEYCAIRDMVKLEMDHVGSFTLAKYDKITKGMARALSKNNAETANRFVPLTAILTDIQENHMKPNTTKETK